MYLVHVIVQTCITNTRALLQFNTASQISGSLMENKRFERTPLLMLLTYFYTGLTDVGSSKAQLGLGHAYSRAKVKFNVNKSDNMIIQSIALLDQLDKDVNTFSMRIREWYSYHFPGLSNMNTFFLIVFTTCVLLQQS